MQKTAVTVIRNVTTRYLDTRVPVTKVTRNLRLILIVAWRPMVCLCFLVFTAHQRSYGEVMFSFMWVSICLFTRGCLCSVFRAPAPTPTGTHLPLYRAMPLPDTFKFVHYKVPTVGERLFNILLECFLIVTYGESIRISYLLH